VTAIDCATGETVWKAPNPRGWEMSHISLASMEFAGRRFYIYGGLTGVAGVSTEDGSILWEFTGWRANVAWVATPVVVGPDRVFLSTGYNAGSMMLDLTEKGGRIAAEQLFELKPKVFGAEQHTPVFYEGHIYGVRPKGELCCLDPDGNVLWESGDDRFYKGYGPWLVAQGMIFIMDSEGVLSLVEATPAGYRRLARAKVLHGHDSWGPMALAGARLICRDAAKMVCLDVGVR
jgi:outer membrane protein assembly factor BamB